MSFLKEIDNPITFCGLGAQSTKDLNIPQKLVDSLIPIQIKFFKTLSERAISLGVRGEFTADCLNLMGIKNVRIIGCPSFYKYFNGVYPVIPQPQNSNVQMTFTSGAIKNCKILEFGMKNKYIWLIQENREYPKKIIKGKYHLNRQ